MNSINDWCSQVENTQKSECINKKIEDQRTTNIVSIVATASSSTTSLDSTSSPPYKGDAMSLIVPISIIGAILLLFTIIACVTIRFISKSRNSNSGGGGGGSSNSNLLLSLFSPSKKVKNKSSQTEILTSNTKQDEGEEDYGGEEENGKEKKSEGGWEIISIGEGDQATGNDNINNNSTVIEINNDDNNNNNYHHHNNSGDDDMINKMMSEINGEKYYNGIKVPPLGARIIPLERQMEISKELSEKQNYYQYYNQSH